MSGPADGLVLTAEDSMAVQACSRQGVAWPPSRWLRRQQSLRARTRFSAWLAAGSTLIRRVTYVEAGLRAMAGNGSQMPLSRRYRLSLRNSWPWTFTMVRASRRSERCRILCITIYAVERISRRQHCVRRLLQLAQVTHPSAASKVHGLQHYRDGGTTSQG